LGLATWPSVLRNLATVGCAERPASLPDLSHFASQPDHEQAAWAALLAVLEFVQSDSPPPNSDHYRSSVRLLEWFVHNHGTESPLAAPLLAFSAAQLALPLLPAASRETPSFVLSRRLAQVGREVQAALAARSRWETPSNSSVDAKRMVRLAGLHDRHVVRGRFSKRVWA